jgi:hypothetical protein
MTMPDRLQRRPQWKGMPVPFITLVGAEDSTQTPNFKTVDVALWEISVKQKLCGLCGEPLEYWCWWIGSEDHIRKQIFFDLHMHRECADYACYSCPYIAYGKAYGNTIRPSPGATIVELCPREELGNEGVPVFLARGRRDSVHVVTVKMDRGKPIWMAASGKLFDVTPIARRERTSD